MQKKTLQTNEQNTKNEKSIKYSIDQIDISILYYLVLEKRLDEIKSAKLNDILIYIQEKNKITYYTVMRRVKKMVKEGYILQGYKIGNAATYYLSDKGINFMEQNFLNKNIYKYEPINEEEENYVDDCIIENEDDTNENKKEDK